MTFGVSAEVQLTFINTLLISLVKYMYYVYCSKPACVSHIFFNRYPTCVCVCVCVNVDVCNRRTC